MTPRRLRTARRRGLRIALLPAALCAGIGCLAVPRPAARAADGPEPAGGEDELQKKIREKMEEILRLMRENGRAILDASRTGGEKPAGVEVTPPETPPNGATPPPSGATTPPEGGGTGGGAPSGGDDVRKRIDELVRQIQGAGGSIPKEFEELVRMIPIRKGSSGGSGSPESNPRSSGSKPPSPGGDSKRDPKDGSEKPDSKPSSDPKNGDKPPPDGEKDAPRQDETPPWVQELPPEVRASLLNASPDRVPEKYRERLIRYQKWLQENSGKR